MALPFRRSAGIEARPGSILVFGVSRAVNNFGVDNGWFAVLTEDASEDEIGSALLAAGETSRDGVPIPEKGALPVGMTVLGFSTKARYMSGARFVYVVWSVDETEVEFSPSRNIGREFVFPNPIERLKTTDLSASGLGRTAREALNQAT